VGTADEIAAAPFLTSLPARLDPSPWDRTVRYRDARDPPGALPAWWADRRGPLVYVTFGSVVAHTDWARGVFRTAIDALEVVEARVLLTVGRAFDPAALGAVPANVHVERWVPQASVLAACDAVVCHGGSGTTYGALAAGVPLVVCPLYADNERNGAAVAGVGAGIVVAMGTGASRGTVAALALREAVERVLAAPSFRAAARAIGAEMQGCPDAAAAVASIDWSPAP